MQLRGLGLGVVKCAVAVLATSIINFFFANLASSIITIVGVCHAARHGGTAKCSVKSTSPHVPVACVTMLSSTMRRCAFAFRSTSAAVSHRPCAVTARFPAIRSMATRTTADIGIDSIGIKREAPVHFNLDYDEIFQHEVEHNEGIIATKKEDTFCIRTGALDVRVICCATFVAPRRLQPCTPKPAATRGRCVHSCWCERDLVAPRAVMPCKSGGCADTLVCTLFCGQRRFMAARPRTGISWRASPLATMWTGEPSTSP